MDDVDPIEPRQRFARLVGSSVARRLAVPRLALAVAVAGSVVITLGFVLTWAARSIVDYVDTRPEQQISFSKIELVPEPGPWVKGNKDLILEQVRTKSKLPASLKLLDLNLEELTSDFKKSPWIKRVIRITRPHGRLVVEVQYREPVAAVILERTDNKKKWVAEMIDEEGVPLPPSEIEWKSIDYPYSVQGIPEPLILIRKVNKLSVPNYGIPWEAFDSNGKSLGPDLMVANAAKLARFFRKQATTTPKGNQAPKVVNIFVPEEPNNFFYISDQIDSGNLIAWGKPPGDEKPGELTAESRWKMILDWVDRYGPIQVKPDWYLQFTSDGLKLVEPTVRPKKNLQNR